MKTSPSSTARYAIHRSSTPQSKLLEIKREFNVSVDQLFDAFTTSKAIQSWWWPHGLHADRVEIDFREGGKYFISMKRDDVGGSDGSIPDDVGGGGMVGEFEEIITNKRIVSTDQFADRNGQPISAEAAGMTGLWPEQIYITFEFEAVDENTSRFALAQQGIPTEQHENCIQGWSESFTKLEKYLNGRKN